MNSSPKQTAFLVDSSRLLQRVASIMDADPALFITDALCGFTIVDHVLFLNNDIVGLVKTALEKSLLLLTEVYTYIFSF